MSTHYYKFGTQSEFMITQFRLHPISLPFPILQHLLPPFPTLSTRLHPSMSSRQPWPLTRHGARRLVKKLPIFTIGTRAGLSSMTLCFSAIEYMSHLHSALRSYSIIMTPHLPATQDELKQLSS